MIRSPILLAAAALAACSPSAAGPNGSSPNIPATRTVAGGTTLRVFNPTSNSYEISASPVLNPPIPQPPGGLIDLGPAAPGTSCLLLPARFDEFMTTLPSGQRDTLTWRSSAPLSILALGQGTDLSASTPYFVPDSAAGWTITVPGNGVVSAARDTPCTP
jgi:hypothetical protein